MSPVWASRMPATPRISRSGSPVTSPPSSSASSLSVRVTMGPAFLSSSLRTRGRGWGAALELVQDGGREVQRLVGVDDVTTRGVEHQVQAAVTRDLLHRRADVGHHVAGGALVFLHRLAGRAPDVLDEPLVVADRALQRLLLLLPLEGRQDRRLVANFVAQLIDRFLLLRRLVAPAGHLAVEAGLRFLGRVVLLEDASRVNIADPQVRGAARARGGPRPPRHQAGP